MSEIASSAVTSFRLAMPGQSRDFTPVHHAACARYRAETGAPYEEIARVAFEEGLYGVEFARLPGRESVRMWCARAAETATPEHFTERLFVIADSLLTLELAQTERSSEKLVSLLVQMAGLPDKLKRSRVVQPPKPPPTSKDQEPEEEQSPSTERLRSLIGEGGRAIGHAETESAVLARLDSPSPAA